MRCLVLALCFFATTAFASDLATLRNEYALHYFDAEAHLRLAKHLRDQGDSLDAFYISESARRTRFDDEEFMKAFAAVFHEDHFDGSDETKRRLTSELDSATRREAKTLMALADIHISRGEWKTAETLLREVLSLEPALWTAVDGLAEVMRRDGREGDAETLVREWLAKHPDSVVARRQRIQELSESDEGAAVKAIEAALGQYPDDAMLHLQRATMLGRRDDVEGAAAAYERASQLAPDSAWIRGWTGRFYLKRRNDREKALQHYLAAYFADPHFYDTEYAEGRIREIAWSLAAAEHEAKLAAGATLPQLLADPHPVIVSNAIEAADAEWKAEYLEPLVALLGHVDPAVRYPAAAALGKHADASFDDRLEKLLTSDDLLTRSAAAYVAGERWQQKALPLVEPWLTHPSELLQYDAISIHVLHGGETGLATLRRLEATGTIRSERIRAMIRGIESEPAADKP